MKAAIATSCVATKGGSDCVGASALSIGALLKRLYNQDEEIEIKSNHCGHSINGTPDADEIAHTGHNRDREHHE